MDLYLTSTEPGLTLQEMIDCDIKCGIDFEDGYGLNMDQLMHSHEIDCLDLSGMSNLEGELGFKSFEPLFDPLEKLEEDEPLEVVSSSRHESSKGDVVASWMNFSSMSHLNMDIEPGTMVNPSAVLPSILHGGTRAMSYQLSASAPVSSPPVHEFISRSSSSSDDSSSNATSRSGSTLSSCSSSDMFISNKEFEVVSSVHQQIGNTGSGQSQPETINTRVVLHPVNSTANTTTSVSLPIKNSNIHTTTFVTNSINRVPSTPMISVASTQNSIIQHLSSTPPTTIQHLNNHSSTNLTPITSVSPLSRNGTPTYQQNRTTNTTTNLVNRGKPKYKLERNPDEKSFPKPAYSYSCLIALALKNSINGSLPVSEIYSFMCEHFPYFRTAPNGWKNSVRHNLSLNKCFEKIEKPVVSGSNQRKGCLWALNPAKAHKMDEEVQKWSKKDLQGIKDAMTNPEILENLERGEMKFEATSSGASSCSEDEEEEDMDLQSSADAQTNTELQPIKIINPISNPVILPSNQKSATRLIQHTNGVRTVNHLTTKVISQVQKQNNNTNLVGLTQRISQSENQHSQQLFRRVAQPTTTTLVPSTQEPEFILPDSTMQEISIQSNGAIIDDFGNEISLEGELGILNPSGNSTNNLILRKVNASPLRHTSIRSNFVYATSPHQNGLNRLVLANTKMS